MGGECQGHLPHPLKPSRITRIHAHTRTCVTRTRSFRQSHKPLVDFKAHSPFSLLTMLHSFADFKGSPVLKPRQQNFKGSQVLKTLQFA